MDHFPKPLDRIIRILKTELAAFTIKKVFRIGPVRKDSCEKLLQTQPVFTCSNSTMETPEQWLKHVQS